jgi:hypothetical protein
MVSTFFNVAAKKSIVCIYYVDIQLSPPFSSPSQEGGTVKCCSIGRSMSKEVSHPFDFEARFSHPEGIGEPVPHTFIGA